MRKALNENKFVNLRTNIIKDSGLTLLLKYTILRGVNALLNYFIRLILDLGLFSNRRSRPNYDYKIFF